MNRPTEGGRYMRDPQTGKATRVGPKLEDIDVPHVEPDPETSPASDAPLVAEASDPTLPTGRVKKGN